MRSICSRNSFFFVRTCENSSFRVDRLICLFILLLYHFGNSASTRFVRCCPNARQNTAVINNGVTILTASRSTESSIEINGHGLFTSLFLEALSGGAADITGNITPGGVYAFIDKALGPWEQRPVFKTNVTRFTSLRNVIPQVDISIIRKICTYFTSENEKFAIDPSFEPTNSPSITHKVIEPYANPTNTEVFSDLQKLEGIGLVVPVGEEHMYFAAMNSKACELTSIGKQYWRLVHDKLI